MRDVDTVSWNFVTPLHFVILGILAGMWPCGIVVLVAELFRAESKAQVYAALHELLTNHLRASSDLSKYSKTTTQLLPQPQLHCKLRHPIIWNLQSSYATMMVVIWEDTREIHWDVNTQKCLENLLPLKLSSTKCTWKGIQMHGAMRIVIQDISKNSMVWVVQ